MKIGVVSKKKPKQQAKILWRLLSKDLGLGTTLSQYHYQNDQDSPHVYSQALVANDVVFILCDDYAIEADPHRIVYQESTNLDAFELNDCCGMEINSADQEVSGLKVVYKRPRDQQSKVVYYLPADRSRIIQIYKAHISPQLHVFRENISTTIPYLSEVSMIVSSAAYFAKESMRLLMQFFYITGLASLAYTLIDYGKGKSNVVKALAWTGAALVLGIGLTLIALTAQWIAAIFVISTMLISDYLRYRDMKVYLRCLAESASNADQQVLRFLKIQALFSSVGFVLGFVTTLAFATMVLFPFAMPIVMGVMLIVAIMQMGLFYCHSKFVALQQPVLESLGYGYIAGRLSSSDSCGRTLSMQRFDMSAEADSGEQGVNYFFSNHKTEPSDPMIELQPYEGGRVVHAPQPEKSIV